MRVVSKGHSLMSNGHGKVYSLINLDKQVNALIQLRKYGEALDAIRHFIDTIINDDRSVAKFFASAELDRLCQSIGEAIAVIANDKKQVLATPKQGTVILISDLVLAGGHIELIKDIINLNLFEAPISILVTDIFNRVDDDLVADFSIAYHVDINVVRANSSWERIESILCYLDGLSPKKLVLLNHNQDSIAIAVAYAYNFDQIIFIHHGDHHLTLGVTSDKFIHVDPSSNGFFHCRDELNLKSNFYWPLVLNNNNLKPKTRPFLKSGHLTTCSSGRPEKFNNNYYLYDYFEIIPKLLALTGGYHVHIGHVDSDMLDILKIRLSDERVDAKKFIHIPWVPSIAEALIENNVDLYISSFPLGGGKSIVEAMGIGIPLLIHQSYRSRFHCCIDIAYKEAWVWSNEDELFRILGQISEEDLIAHSVFAKSHFDKYHNAQLLVSALDFSKPQDISLVPKLRKYEDDKLQIFLDEKKKSDFIEQENLLHVEQLNKELERLISNSNSIKLLLGSLFKLLINKIVK